MRWALRVGFLGVLFLTMIIAAIAVTWRPEPGHRNGPTGNVALVTAAKEGSIDRTASLLEEGADADSSDAGGYSALWWAVRQGHTDVVVVLVEAGADPELAGPTGESPRALARELARSDPSPTRVQISAFLGG